MADVKDIGSELAVEAYTSIIATGVRMAFVFGVSVFAMMWVIYKVYIQYKKGLESEDGIDYKAILDLVKPIIPYYLVLLLMPMVLSVVEVFLYSGETYIYKLLGIKTSTVLEILQEEAAHDQNPDSSTIDYEYSWTDPMSFIDTTLGIIDASLSLWIKKIIALADGYLYSIVQGIRYLWLILLEITAPIAIALFFLSDKENNYKARFENWLVNMYSCYMLGIGFIIANFFSEVIRTKIWDHYQLDNVGVLILIIIIKITLYTTSKWASSRLL